MNMEKYRIERYKILPSTNDYAKQKRTEGENLIVIAAAQSGGRGTKGRSFDSGEGGLYMSILTFPENVRAKGAFTIMQNAAAAVCETLVAFGLQPTLKWPNDVLVGGKKICGILIENTFLGEWVRSSVVGIGLNIRNALPRELQEIATSIALETGRLPCLLDVEKVLIENLSNGRMHERYTQYLGFIGEEVTLLMGEERIRARLIGVDSEGNLIAETATGRSHFSAAEVSLRGIDG